MQSLTERIEAMSADYAKRVGYMPRIDQELIADQLQYVLTCNAQDYATIGAHVLLCIDLQNSTIGLGPINRRGLIAPNNSTNAATIAA